MKVSIAKYFTKCMYVLKNPTTKLLAEVKKEIYNRNITNK